MRSLMLAVSGSKVTVACSVARLTLAALTPEVLLSAFSTLRAQLAQVMPVMARPDVVSAGSGGVVAASMSGVAV
jgi:hypothetical protein